jgi:hypothetical protein
MFWISHVLYIPSSIYYRFESPTSKRGKNVITNFSSFITFSLGKVDECDLYAWVYKYDGVSLDEFHVSKNRLILLTFKTCSIYVYTTKVSSVQCLPFTIRIHIPKNKTKDFFQHKIFISEE